MPARKSHQGSKVRTVVPLAVPRRLLRSKYRKTLWSQAQQVLQALERSIPVSRAYVLGSFTTKKRRPADVDLIILLQTPKKSRAKNWSVDLVLTSEGDHGNWVLEDARKWMKQKYGARKSAVIKVR